MFAHLRTQACSFLDAIDVLPYRSHFPIIGLVSDPWPSMVGVYCHAVEQTFANCRGAPLGSQSGLVSDRLLAQRGGCGRHAALPFVQPGLVPCEIRRRSEEVSSIVVYCASSPKKTGAASAFQGLCVLAWTTHVWRMQP